MKKLSSIVILTFLVSAVIGFSVDPGNKYDYGRNGIPFNSSHSNENNPGNKYDYGRNGVPFNSSHSNRNTPGHKYDYGHKPFKK